MRNLKKKKLRQVYRKSGKNRCKNLKNKHLEATTIKIIVLAILLYPLIFGGLVSAGYWYGEEPLAYWKMENLTDNKGVYNLTNNGVEFVNGLLNNASGNYANPDCLNNSDILLNGTSFTIAAWVNKTGEIGGNDFIWVNQQFTQIGSMTLYSQDDDGLNTRLVVYLNNDEHKETYLYSNMSFVLNNSVWHRIVITRDNSTDTNNLKMYIDGKLNNQTSMNKNSTFRLNSFHIGGQTGSNAAWENGEIDEVAIYTNVWTSADVTKDYNNGFGLEADNIAVVTETGEAHNATTYETKEEGFTYSITFSSANWTSITANLIYNGIAYLGTKVGLGNNLTFRRNLDIPILPASTPQTKSFYWSVALTNSTSTQYENSTVRTQTVSPLVFTFCNATHPETIVNFSGYNESSKTSINISFNSDFLYYIGSGSIVKNYSYKSSETNETFEFCGNVNETFFVTSTTKATAIFFNDRNFYLNQRSYNISRIEHFLYLSDEGTNVIIEVKDAGLTPLENWFVEIERYYEGDNSYEIVEYGKTDIYGQLVARLIENTKKYRFTFKDEDGVVRKTTGDITIACRSTICVLPFVIEDTTDDFDRFDNVTDYDWSFSYDEDTNIFTFSWVDVSGVTATNRLIVTRYLVNGTTNVCNSTLSSATGSMTCNIGSQSASYQAQIFRRIGIGEEKRLSTLSIKVGDETDTFGTEGLLWSFLLLMTMISVGYIRPAAGIILYLFGVILLSIIHVLYVNPAILIAQFAIGVAFIWAFKR